MPNTSFSAKHSEPEPVIDAVRILVAGSLTPPDVADYLREILRDLYECAISAIHRSLGEVVFIEASSPDHATATVLDGIDGLLILGGADADPACYGQEREADTMYGINPDADRLELELLRDAGVRDLPVLGICRGMQLINILRGGDLVQEIGAGTVHNGSADNSLMVAHPVELEPGSRLEAIYGRRTLSVSSGHHQAVSRVGKGLVVAARAADGIVEAIEANDQRWMIGVQWHPEYPAAPRADLDRLMASFVEAARETARAKAL